MANTVCAVAQLQVGDRFMHWARPLRVESLQPRDGKIEVSAQDSIAHCVWTLLFDGDWKVMKVVA
jgi:hypothetical protein